MNNIENPNSVEQSPEVMKLPEIEVQEKKGPMLLSILLRGYDHDFGGHQHELSQEVDNFFKQNPLNEETINFLKEIRAIESNGIDGETLFNMALTRETNETETLSKFVSEYKNPIQNLQEIRDKLIEALNNLETSLPSELMDKFAEATSEDISMRNNNLEDPQKRIKQLIEFFKPNAKTTKIEKIIILPTNFLFDEKSGSCMFGPNNDMYISSHIDNPHNMEHEFLHSVINPIITKLEAQLTDDQKMKIVELASNNLKYSQEYGEEYYSLLCEEFIRTYNDIFQKDDKPLTEDDFVQKIDSVSDEQFNDAITNNDILRKQCSQLNISTLEELKRRSKEYYDKFEKNDLRNIIFSLYQEYEKEKGTNFEQFVLEQFSKRI
ncbi:hypothetical protein ISR92_00860 [Patescibacteria group bacterium]|nr:hypothetical protein [Patescibacteria group bacterium]